jgi:hypothetical protein
MDRASDERLEIGCDEPGDLVLVNEASLLWRERLESPPSCRESSKVVIRN